MTAKKHNMENLQKKRRPDERSSRSQPKDNGEGGIISEPKWGKETGTVGFFKELFTKVNRRQPKGKRKSSGTRKRVKPKTRIPTEEDMKARDRRPADTIQKWRIPNRSSHKGKKNLFAATKSTGSLMACNAPKCSEIRKKRGGKRGKRWVIKKMQNPKTKSTKKNKKGKTTAETGWVRKKALEGGCPDQNRMQAKRKCMLTEKVRTKARIAVSGQIEIQRAQQ